MGQRHQLFVIARVGNHYRTLAAVHHQWLYGVSALRSCRRLLRIFSDVNNRITLKHELDLATGFFKDQGPPPSRPPSYEEAEEVEERPCPFPFITTCLATGAAYDSEVGRVQTIHELAFNTGFNQGDNNDGITVLDITDPADVRYCFVNLFERDDDEDSDSPDSPGACTPLTGREYVGGYYDESDVMIKDNMSLIEALDKSPLVKVGALADTWPWGDWQLEDVTAQPEELGGQTEARNPTKSLRDLAAAKLFDRLLLSTDDDFDPSLLDHVRDMPGFQKMLKEHLLSHLTTVGPVGATKASAYLLQLAYAGEACLEWNVFETLTVETINAALASDALKSVTTICLTDLRYDSLAEFVKVLSSLDCLHTLQILNRPDRKDEHMSVEIFEAIAESTQPISIKKLTLSGLYANGLRQNIWRPYRHNPKTPEAFPVVQLLVAHEGKDSTSSFSSGGKMEYFYLGDAALSPVRAVIGLFQYVASLIRDPRSYHGTGLNCAHTFSCGPSALENADSIEISPLPAETYKVGKAGYHSSAFSGLYSKMRDLIPGAWTVVVSESSSTDYTNNARTRHLQCRYAFVHLKVPIQVDPEHWRGSNIEPSEIEVVDVQGFLRVTAPDVDLSKVAHHFDRLEMAVAQATGERDTVITAEDSPLSLLSHDEARGLLNQFIATVPEMQQAAGRVGRWGDSWVSDLGFNVVEKPDEATSDSNADC
ncbi:hypothetical protein QQX98_009027 [Neonectria punicea]|uniref:Uncharacterized protein n=1 Tax=Neonectria punicea TaxID=979145 RepID=A0ABR1GTE1_9HYPO